VLGQHGLDGVGGVAQAGLVLVLDGLDQAAARQASAARAARRSPTSWCNVFGISDSLGASVLHRLFTEIP